MHMQRAVGPGLYLLGAGVLIALFFIGPRLDAVIRPSGLHAYLQQAANIDLLMFFIFAFAFPAGLLLCALGALSLRGAGWRRMGLAFVLLLPLIALSMLWPAWLGRAHSPLYFGAGGAILVLLIIAVSWYWQRLHSSADHPAHYLRGLAYFCFALATWNSCGAGGLPGFALYPQTVIDTHNQAFLIGQYKVIMIYFILAWLFLLISLYRQTKTRNTRM